MTSANVYYNVTIIVQLLYVQNVCIMFINTLMHTLIIQMTFELFVGVCEH